MIYATHWEVKGWEGLRNKKETQWESYFSIWIRKFIQKNRNTKFYCRFRILAKAPWSACFSFRSSSLNSSLCRSTFTTFRCARYKKVSPISTYVWIIVQKLINKRLYKNQFPQAKCLKISCSPGLPRPSSPVCFCVGAWPLSTYSSRGY